MTTRRHLLVAIGGLAVAAAGLGAAQTPAQAVATESRSGIMEIKRSGSQPSGEGPAEYFTGTVRIDPLFEAPAPARLFAPASPSSRVHAPHGIPIRWVRP